MRVLVALKRTIDYQVKIRVKSDGSGVETQGVKMSINPFDEIAVEAALQLKEQGVANEVVAVTIGEAACDEVLRHALAMGADRAIRIEHAGAVEPLVVAKWLHKIVSQETPQIVILGKQAIDDDCNQTGQMLAGLLAWGQGTFASKINVQGDYLEVTREVDEGLETLRLKLPCVVTTDLRLNTPRYISLPNIMKAKQKSLQVIPAEEFGEARQHVLQQKLESPPVRSAGVKVETIKELMQKLNQEAKVL